MNPILPGLVYDIPFTKFSEQKIELRMVPAVAAECLSPGQHVGMDDNKKASSANPIKIGVVDPYIKCDVMPGQHFLVFLYYNPSDLGQVELPLKEKGFTSKTPNELIAILGDEGISIEKRIRTARECMKMVGEMIGLSYIDVKRAVRHYYNYSASYNLSFSYEKPSPEHLKLLFRSFMIVEYGEAKPTSEYTMNKEAGIDGAFYNYKSKLT